MDKVFDIIKDKLKDIAGSTVVFDDSDADTAANELELAIREKIAVELEDLVTPADGKRFRYLGCPETVGGLTATRQRPTEQQDYFRSAANVVRGRVLATEQDWMEQRHRIIEKMEAAEQPAVKAFLEAGIISRIGASAVSKIEEFPERFDPTSTAYCQWCDYDKHICPGCGAGLPHGIGACKKCKDDSEES